MRKKVLVIDDDEGILAAFEALLGSERYDVETSAVVDPLLQRKDNFPDLILLDVLLSGVDGRDICKKLKQQILTQHIPIIMISAATNVRNSIMEAQADDFLAKPFDSKDLINKVKKYIGDPN